MIYCGISESKKIEFIKKELKEKQLEKIFFAGEKIDYDFGVPTDTVTFQDSIMYVNYYRFLAGVDESSLFVWNNCMKSKNRYCLNYNCIRKYMQQTSKRMIFETFPLISEKEDFMILWDMDQPNPFLKDKYEYIEKFTNTIFGNVIPEIIVTQSELSEIQKEKYQEIKEEAIAAVKKNAEIIPNRLLKFSEAQNQKNENKIFDSKKSLKIKMNICVNKSGVDQYFYKELQRTLQEIKDVCQKIQH